MNKDLDTQEAKKPDGFQVFWHHIRYKTMVVDVDENNIPTKTIEKKRSPVLVYLVIFLAFFVACFFFVPFSDNVRFDMLGTIFSQLFVPSKWSLKTYDAWWNYLFNTAFLRIWQTIEMVFIATVFGTILAVPFYILASRNITLCKPVNFIIRFLVNLLRTIPTYVLAIIGAIFFGYSTTAGVFAMTLFTFGIIFKLMYEYIETQDMNPFEVSLSNGASRLQAYSLAIHPSINGMFISNFIYTFEINIRASVVLGFVGAGGIGQLLQDAMESTNYDKIGAILIPLTLVVFILQEFSSYVRRKVS